MTTPPPKQYYRLRVLIADDAREARRGTRMMLAMHPGVEVIAIAQNGQQAVELAQEHHPDIAIMDINMPEMDGISAMQRICKAQPQTVFIIISGEDDPHIKQAAAEAGALDFLPKPFTYEELDTALRRAARAWMARRQRAVQASQPTRPAPPDRETLTRLAQEYSQARRSDTQALAIYERLANFPDCELRWLMTLAMTYIIRQDWGKLKALAEKLERLKST
jgi:YesN/AraC family two-component response regulator